MHTILMVADEPDELELLKAGFQKAGIGIDMIHAKTGTQLLQVLSTSMPSIIFLDLRLSTAYSWHIIEQVRQRAIYNDIPIVMYTVSNDATLIHEGFRTGADLVLLRTNNITELSESLNNIFISDWKCFKQQRLARKLCLRNSLMNNNQNGLLPATG
ncbi:MAG: response regulator [Niastella sp.]|nr:response regulator [Niastella sp.]